MRLYFLVMPWKTTSLGQARLRLVQAVLAGKRPLKELCGDFGVSRPVAYKWLARFREKGRGGLTDRSRRPRHSANQIDGKWQTRIEHWRRRRPHWGARKLRCQLKRDHPRSAVPCERTIHRLLKREGWVRAPKRRARRGPTLPYAGLTTPRRSNEVWTVDFKGWFVTTDGVRQEPLTVRDLFSRYGLCLRLLSNQEDRAARRVLQGLFRLRGVPKVIRVDNGSPFSGTGALGLSRLSVWWLRLGIRVEFTRRARPGDNAAHEQFHGCYQREIVNSGGANRRLMQAKSNRWLRDYNEQRPHEALGQKTPSQVYRVNPRRYPENLEPIRYPKRWQTRGVRNRGHIKWQGRLRFIGRAFTGQTVGVKTLDNQSWEIYLGKQIIGELHSKDQTGLRPAKRRSFENIKNV